MTWIAERLVRLNDPSIMMEELEDLRLQIEMLRDEEQDYMDNMPENLQGGDRYANASEAVDALDAAAEELDEAISYLDDEWGEEIGSKVADAIKKAVFQIGEAIG